MLRRGVYSLLACGAAVLTGTVAQAQFVSLVTDFEDPGWTPFVTEVMFRAPSVSGTTTGLDPNPAIGNGTFLTDIASDPFSVVHSGTRALAAFWGWLNPGYHTSWVRLVTTNAAELPNPALHLGGKVRLWIAVKAYTDGTFAVPVTTGALYLGIGVRETGAGVYQGGDGGSSGDVEWVGLSARLVEILGGTNGTCDTTANPASDDIQVIPPGQPAGPDDVCVDAGPDNVLQTAAGGDDVVRVTPRGMYTVPTDGVMRQYVFDLPALEASGNVFPLAGDGALLATPNNRGTLEHLALTNHPVNGTVGAKVMLVNIDDVEFESPVLDPPTIVGEPTPPRPLDEAVRVLNIKPDADLVEVYRLVPDGSETLLGAADPLGNTEFDVPTAPLAAGIRIVARQTVGASTSDNSTAAIVATAGNGPLRIAMAVRETDLYDHNLSCGQDGTGFDPNQPSNLEFIGASGQDGFGVPIAPRFTPQREWFEIQFNPCDETYGVAQFSGNGQLNLNPAPNYTNGVWEGLYFRIDELSPTTGPFTVYIDDLVVKDSSGAVICQIDDFESYTPGLFIVEPVTGGDGIVNTAAAPTDQQILPVGGPVSPGKKVVGPGPDGTLETTAAGDELYSWQRARFNMPSTAGTSAGLASTPNVTAVTDEESFSGSQSLRVEWAFVDSSNMRNHLRLTSDGGLPGVPRFETYVNPDPVIPFSLDGTLCDGSGDIYYSVMIKLAPPAAPGDCDVDGDVDLRDVRCFQKCFKASPVPPECGLFDIAPNGAPDGVIDIQDFLLLQYLLVGPQL